MTRRRMFLAASIFAATAMTLLLPEAAFAQGGATPPKTPEVRERTLRLAFSVVKDHPLHDGAVRFAELVSERTGGKIKVQIFPGALLGSDAQNLSGLKGGALDMTTLGTSGLAGTDKAFMLMDFPFLFNDFKEAYSIIDGPLGRSLTDKLPKYGLIGLGIWDLGFRNITNSRRPVAKADDIRGLKLRVQATPIYVDLFTTLGANPVPLTFGEVFTALETRTVDGQENPVGLIRSAKFYEVQKYLSLTRHAFTAMPFLMSAKTWEKLSDDERNIILDSAEEAKHLQRRISAEKEASDLEYLKKHMEVLDFAPQEIDTFRQRVQPVVDKYTGEVGAGLVDQVKAEIAKVRGK